MLARRFSHWFALLAGSVLLSGCTAFGSRQPQTASAPQRPHELPADKTVDLCLATAAELEKRGFENEAIPQYEKARELAPQRAAWVARRLAVLYDRQGADDRAQVEYERALKLQPGDADLLNDVGFFHCRRGEPAEAERWLRQALSVNDHHPQATLNLALAVGRQGRYEESLRLFGQVVTPAQAQYNLAVLLAKDGHDVEAQTCLQHAIQLDSNFAPARTMLARLQMPQPAQAKAETPSPVKSQTVPSAIETRAPLVAEPERPRVQPIVQAQLVTDDPTSVPLPPISPHAH